MPTRVSAACRLLCVPSRGPSGGTWPQQSMSPEPCPAPLDVRSGCIPTPCESLPPAPSHQPIILTMSSSTCLHLLVPSPPLTCPYVSQPLYQHLLLALSTHLSEQPEAPPRPLMLPTQVFRCSPPSPHPHPHPPPPCLIPSRVRAQPGRGQGARLIPLGVWRRSALDEGPPVRPDQGHPPLRFTPTGRSCLS